MNRTRIAIAVGASILFVAVSFAQPRASALLREGDIIGPTGEEVTSISNTAVNQVGGFAFGGVFESLAIQGSPSVSFFYGNPSGGAGSILRTEGVVDGLTQNSFESFFGLADDGKIAYSASVDGAPVPSADSVFLGGVNVMAEGQDFPSLPDQFWRFGSRPNTTADGDPWFVGGITSTQGGSTEARGLFRGIDGASIVLLEGDVVPGVPDLLESISFNYQFSALGSNYLTEIATTGPSTADGAMVLNGEGLVVGGNLVAEGTPVPASVGGMNGEAWDNFDKFGVTEAGDYLITGDTDGPTNADEFVFVNGQMVLREGDVIDGRTLSGSIEAGFMNESADWAVIWDIDLDDNTNVEALIVNGEILLAEGEEVDWDGNGIVDDGAVLTNFTGIDSLTVGPNVNGVFDVYFTADVDLPNGDTLEGAFRITVPEPASVVLLALGLALGIRRR